MSTPSPNAVPVLRTSDVFNPGQFPNHTYRPRAVEENKVTKWSDNRGNILVVNGPSKTGKTVLVQKLLDNSIWIDGHGLTSTEVLWSRIADKLELFTGFQQSVGKSETHSSDVEGRVGASSTYLGGKAGSADGTTSGVTQSVDRPIAQVAYDALLAADRPLVIDDIHFVAREVQEQIIMALKPLVSGVKGVKGGRVVFISIGNRVINVLSNLVDMRSRMLPLNVDYWNESELIAIAQDGFAKLSLVDAEGSIAKTLAKESFGSPQLMQQLCRELCASEPNNVMETSGEAVEISLPSDWTGFLKDQFLDDIESWVTKLAKGPETRGNSRSEIKLKDDRVVDSYQLILIAAAKTGPKLSLSKDELRVAIAEVVDRTPPPTTVPTGTLKNMSLIAATKLLDKIPSLRSLEEKRAAGFDPYAQGDLQPVLEYKDTGATSVLNITDPFFAFYLAWGLDDLLHKLNTPRPAGIEDDDKKEAEEWGDG